MAVESFTIRYVRGASGAGRQGHSRRSGQENCESGKMEPAGDGRKR